MRGLRYESIFELPCINKPSSKGGKNGFLVLLGTDPFFCKEFRMLTRKLKPLSVMYCVVLMLRGMMFGDSWFFMFL